MIHPKLSTASAYIPASNCARASASRTLRDRGSAWAAWFSRVTAAAGFPPSSRSRPRVYQSYTSPWGRTSGGGGGASANGGAAAASSSQCSSSRLPATGGPPLSSSGVAPRTADSPPRSPRCVHPVCGPDSGPAPCRRYTTAAARSTRPARAGGDRCRRGSYHAAMTSASPVPPASSLPVPTGLALAPFRGLRYAVADSARLARLTSPPYDVVDEEERH